MKLNLYPLFLLSLIALMFFLLLVGCKSKKSTTERTKISDTLIRTSLTYKSAPIETNYVIDLVCDTITGEITPVNFKDQSGENTANLIIENNQLKAKLKVAETENKTDTIYKVKEVEKEFNTAIADEKSKTLVGKGQKVLPFVEPPTVDEVTKKARQKRKEEAEKAKLKPKAEDAPIMENESKLKMFENSMKERLEQIHSTMQNVLSSNVQNSTVNPVVNITAPTNNISNDKGSYFQDTKFALSMNS